jgi:hypothetical protein
METKDSLQSTVVRALMKIIIIISIIISIITSIIIIINEVPLNVQSAVRTVFLSIVGFDTR